MPIGADQWRAVTGLNNVRRPRQVGIKPRYMQQETCGDNEKLSHEPEPDSNKDTTGGRARSKRSRIKKGSRRKGRSRVEKDRITINDSSCNRRQYVGSRTIGLYSSVLVLYLAVILSSLNLATWSTNNVNNGFNTLGQVIGDNYTIPGVFESSSVSGVQLLQSFISVVVMLLLLLSGDVETNPGPTTVLSVDDHLRYVKEAVWQARAQWKNIGRSLGLSEGAIQSIHDQDDSECLHAVLLIWIHTGNATINDLLDALENRTVGRRDLAHNIRALKGKDRINIGLEPDTDNPQPQELGVRDQNQSEADSTGVPSSPSSSAGAESPLVVTTSDLHELDDSVLSLIPSSPHSAGNSPAEQVQHFEGRFHELRTCAITEVMDKHVPVARFRQTLMTLPNAISKEHEEFFIEKYSIFMQADSVEYIFLHLNFYLSFIDFSLLMHIIQHFGSSSLQQKMKQYSIDMETFRTETPVIDIIPYLSGRPEPPPHFTRLKMKLNFNVKTCTLEVLEQHRRKFGSEFSLSKFVLFLVELKEGSLVEVWLIPSNIIPTLKDRVQQKSLTFFHNLEILEFYVNEECLYPLHALEDASVRTLPVCLQTDLCLIENREEDVPVITPSRRRIWNEITSEIDSTPESRGLAFIATCFSASRRINSLEINSLLISNRTLASMFGRLKFAVFEKRIESQEELSDVIYIATSHLMRYPKSLHYSIVVVVAGWVEYNVNTLPTRQGKININSDLIEPFLPHSAPALVDIPKLFLINTVTLGDGPLDALGLNVPSEGNFLISYTNTSDRDITEVVEVLSVRLGNSHDSIEDVLTNVKEQMPHSTTMTVISTLNKPMYLNPDNSS